MNLAQHCLPSNIHTQCTATILIYNYTCTLYLWYPQMKGTQFNFISDAYDLQTQDCFHQQWLTCVRSCRVHMCAVLVIEKKKEHNYLLDKERRLRCRSKLRTKELLKFQISCFLEFTKHHTLATFKVQTTNHTALSPTSRTATSINSLMYRHTPRSPLECSEKKTCMYM